MRRLVGTAQDAVVEVLVAGGAEAFVEEIELSGEGVELCREVVHGAEMIFGWAHGVTIRAFRRAVRARRSVGCWVGKPWWRRAGA